MTANYRCVPCRIFSVVKGQCPFCDREMEPVDSHQHAMRLIAAIVLFVVIVSVPSIVHAQSALEGVYTVSGANPDGQKYQGVLEVVAKDDAYLFLWTLGKDREGKWLSAYGYGFANKGTVVVGIVSPDGGSLTVATYERDDKGAWSGHWSAAGSGVVCVEALTPSTKTADELRRALPVPGGLAL